MRGKSFKRDRSDVWVKEKQGNLKKNKKYGKLSIERSLEILEHGDSEAIGHCFEFWAVCVERDLLLYNEILHSEHVINLVFLHSSAHISKFFAFFRYIFDWATMIIVKKFTPKHFSLLKKLIIHVFNEQTVAIDDVAIILFVGYTGSSLILTDDDGVLKATVDLINSRGCSKHTHALLVLVCCESYIRRKHKSDRRDFLQNAQLMKLIFECINTATRPDITLGILEIVKVAVKTQEARDQLEDVGGIYILEQLHNNSHGKMTLENTYTICEEIIEIIDDNACPMDIE